MGISTDLCGSWEQPIISSQLRMKVCVWMVVRTWALFTCSPISHSFEKPGAPGPAWHIAYKQWHLSTLRDKEEVSAAGPSGPASTTSQSFVPSTQFDSKWENMLMFNKRWGAWISVCGSDRTGHEKHHSGSLLPKCAMIFHLVTLLHTWKHLWLKTALLIILVCTIWTRLCTCILLSE